MHTKLPTYCDLNTFVFFLYLVRAKNVFSATAKLKYLKRTQHVGVNFLSFINY